MGVGGVAYANRDQNRKIGDSTKRSAYYSGEMENVTLERFLQDNIDQAGGPL